MLSLDVRVGQVVMLQGYGNIRVDHKSGRTIRLVFDVPRRHNVDVVDQDLAACRDIQERYCGVDWQDNEPQAE